MLTLFKFLFRNTARKLGKKVYVTGFENGFKLGRIYEQSRLQGKCVILGSGNFERDIDQILQKAGW